MRPGRLPVTAMFPAGRTEYRVRYVTGAGGYRVRVIETGPEGGPAVLCVHGWGCSVFVFRDEMPALAAQGYRAAAMDLVGHGLSEKPVDRAAYGLDALAGDVLAVAKTLREQVTLVGHSMGATIAARVAAMSPTQVRALVMMSPVGLGRVRDVAIGRLLTPAWLAWTAPYLVPRVAIRIALHFAHAGGRRVRVTPEMIDEYWAPAQFPGFARALRTLLHEFPWHLESVDWVQTVTCPTLVLAGANDRLVDPKSAAAFAQMIPGATLRLIPRAGHAVYDQAPTEINHEIGGFLHALQEAPRSG